MGLALIARFRPREFDVIDVQSVAPIAALVALLKSKAWGTPVIVTWHEFWGRDWYRNMGWSGVFGQLMEWFLARAQATHIAVSHTTARRISKVRGEEVPVVMYGMDPAGFPPRSEDSKKDIDVVFVGRLVPHKRVDVLIGAIGMVQQRRPATLVIVGSGPEDASLRQLAGSTPGVEVIADGMSDEKLWSILQRARLFVSASIREGFGLSALEAMALGTPAVVVRHENNAAVEFVNPRLISEPDRQSLSAMILQLLDDEAELARLSAEVQNASRSYSMTVALERYVATLGLATNR